MTHRQAEVKQLSRQRKVWQKKTVLPKMRVPKRVHDQWWPTLSYSLDTLGANLRPWASQLDAPGLRTRDQKY